MWITEVFMIKSAHLFHKTRQDWSQSPSTLTDCIFTKCKKVQMPHLWAFFIIWMRAQRSVTQSENAFKPTTFSVMCKNSSCKIIKISQEGMTSPLLNKFPHFLFANLFLIILTVTLCGANVWERQYLSSFRLARATLHTLISIWYQVTSEPASQISCPDWYWYC